MGMTYTKIDKKNEQDNLVLDTNFIYKTLLITQDFDSLTFYEKFLPDNGLKIKEGIKKGQIKKFSQKYYPRVNNFTVSNTLVWEGNQLPTNELQTWGNVAMANGCYIKAKYNTTGNIKICNTTAGISDIICTVNGRITPSTATTLGNEYVYFFLSGSTVPNELFSGITTLTEIYFSDFIETVGQKCCYYCQNLTSVTIEGRFQMITSIQNDAFRLCKNIQKVDFTGNSVGNVNYAKECTLGNSYSSPFGTSTNGASLYVQGVEITRLVLLSNVNDYAFRNCGNITQIIVGEIETNEITIGNTAFGSCKQLQTIYFTFLNNKLLNLGDYAFTNCISLTNIEQIDAVKSIGSGCFYNCSSITQCTLYENLQSIGDEAFSETAIEEIKISGFTGTMGDNIFSGCTILNGISCSGTTAPLFKPKAFNGINHTLNLSSKFIFSNNTLRDSYITNKWLCSNCCFSGWTIDGYNILTATYTGNGSSIATSSSSSRISNLNGGTPYYMDNTNYGTGTTSNTSVLTSGATSLSSTVSGYRYRMKLFVPNDLTTLSGFTFQNINMLSDIDLSKLKIDTIGANCFSGCTNLSSVILPATLTTLSLHSFWKCESLMSITSYAITAPTIRSNTFEEVGSLGVLYVPEDTELSYESSWKKNSEHYLGYYDWQIVTITA